MRQEEFLDPLTPGQEATIRRLVAVHDTRVKNILRGPGAEQGDFPAAYCLHKHIALISGRNAGYERST
jgi:hypothetical protein